jgi:threonine dehydrogenase-like Zn-dependent dehydrogenase
MTTSRFDRHTSGHEFVGNVVALGSNFLSVSGDRATSTGRPVLYSTLKLGDKVVSPFTVSCGECRYALTYVSSNHPELTSH